MLPDRNAPLHPLRRPLARDFEKTFAEPHARSRNRQAAGVQGRECHLQALALAGDDVLARHAHVPKSDDAVVKRAQPHEVAAMRHRQPGRIDIDNECSDLFAFLAVHNFRRCLRHHDKHAGFQPVGAPKLFAIQGERRTVGRRVSAETHRRGIGSGVRFRERERRDLVARDARQIFLLLLFRAEEQQRLRDADRLVRGDERGHVCVPTAEQHRGATVVDLR